MIRRSEEDKKGMNNRKTPLLLFLFLMISTMVSTHSCTTTPKKDASKVTTKHPLAVCLLLSSYEPTEMTIKIESSLKRGGKPYRHEITVYPIDITKKILIDEFKNYISLSNCDEGNYDFKLSVEILDFKVEQVEPRGKRFYSAVKYRANLFAINGDNIDAFDGYGEYKGYGYTSVADPVADLSRLAVGVGSAGILWSITDKASYASGIEGSIAVAGKNAIDQILTQLEKSYHFQEILNYAIQRQTAPAELVASLDFTDADGLIPNNTIDASETSTIIARIENTGKGTAFNVNLAIESGKPAIDVPNTIDIGDIAPGQSVKREIPIKAGPDLADGQAVFLIRTNEKRGYSARPVELAVPTAAMTRPELMIAGCNLSDASGLARGNANMIPENNETIAVEPFIRNMGAGDALKVDVRITDITPGIKLVKAEDTLAAINPKTTGRASLAFHIPRTFAGKEFRYTITAKDARGMAIHKTYTVPFEPQSPELYMTYQIFDRRGGEIPGLKNGEEYRIEITPGNIGGNTAADVQLTVKAPSRWISLGSFNGGIGRLGPDEKAPAITIPISIHRAYQENIVTLDAAITQDGFPGLTRKIEIPVMVKQPKLDYQVTLMNGVSETAFTQNSQPRFRVSVSNNGELAATNVKIDFSVSHPTIAYRKQEVIGTVLPGQSQYADFQFFVRGDAATGNLPVDVSVSQADFDGHTSRPMFALMEQGAIRQTVEALGGQAGGQAVYTIAPELYINTPNDNMETMEQAIPLHGSIVAIGKGNALDRITIKLNGRPLEIVSSGPDNLSANRISAVRTDNRFVFNGKLRLEPGQNQLTIIGVDRNNQTCQQTIAITRKARLGDIYAVVIGVSRFANASYNLNYAASDAEKFYNFLRSDAGGGLADDRVRLLTDHEATRARIIREFTQFLGRATRDDTVKIYIATHGLTDEAGALYYLCHNTEIDNLKGTGFSDDDLTKILKDNIHAGKVVLYLDTCHAGLSGLDSRLYARRSIEAVGINEKINKLAIALSKVSKTGMAMFSATSAEGYSLESKEWGGGVFTHCLIEGLQGKANANDDEWVTIQELDNYITRQIMNLSNGKQKPRINSSLPAETTPLSKVK